MRSLLPLLLVLAVFPGAVLAADNGYVLYYLDGTHNVRKIILESSGRPVGESQRLTSIGGYDAFSVSSDGGYVLGLRDISGPKMRGWVWKCFLEAPGGEPVGRVIDVIRSDGAPLVWWSDKGNWVFAWGGQVEGTTYVCSLQLRRQTFSTFGLLAATTADEGCAFVVGDVGCWGEGPTDLTIVDLTSGHTAKFARIRFGDGEFLWVGDTHQCAAIDVEGNVWVGRAKAAKSGLQVEKRALTHSGNCSDLRYVTGQGLYFVQKPPNSTPKAYYSSDLKTLREAAILPKQQFPENEDHGRHEADNLPDIDGLWRWHAATSPDGKLIACPLDRGHNVMPELMVFDLAGRSYAVGRGKAPVWKGSGQVDRAYGPWVRSLADE